MSGVFQAVYHPLPWREFNSQLQVNNATKLWLMWDQELAMKAKTERRIFCYLCCRKIIAKGEVVGM